MQIWTKADYINYFPAFARHLTVARFSSLFEASKMSLKVSRHIVEIGFYQGIGSLLFSKLVKIFKPNTLTLLHGFDWFENAKIKTSQFDGCGPHI
jgi:hypothetical protein